MKRTASILLAAVGCFTSAPFAFAGPSDRTPSRSRDAITSTASAWPDSQSISTILNATRDAGFATTELGITPSHDDWNLGHPRGAFAAPLPKGWLADVSDFISPDWRSMNDDIAAYSSPVASVDPHSELSIGSPPSPDMALLSVPEIPVPAAVVPGLIGVVLAAVAHRKSLKRRSSLR